MQANLNSSLSLPNQAFFGSGKQTHHFSLPQQEMKRKGQTRDKVHEHAEISQLK
jgi:hypothetical protein